MRKGTETLLVDITAITSKVLYTVQIELIIEE
jgi:hypothetical protein